MVRLRLSRKGGPKRPFYHIIATDKRNARDGRYSERLGFYNPMARGEELRIKMDLSRIDYWLSQGAQPSEKVASLISGFRNDPTGEKYLAQKAKKKSKLAAKKQEQAKKAAAGETAEAASDVAEAK